MARSMTGFGRCVLDETALSQTWEIRSVNSRFLDIKWRMPLLVRGLENHFEKIVKRFAGRGRVEITLNLNLAQNEAYMVHFNQTQAKSMYDKLMEFADDLDEPYVPDFNKFLSIPFLWDEPFLELDSDLCVTLAQGLEAALEDWNESRLKEGSNLEKDIFSRILRMQEWVVAISERAPEIKEERISGLRDRLEEMLSQFEHALEEGRFLQEIVILADKLDMSEELTRLTSHLVFLSELLKQGVDIGRKLDFVIQECFREINTCSNKSQDVQVQRLAVEFKNELEKCREQIQNLE